MAGDRQIKKPCADWFMEKEFQSRGWGLECAGMLKVWEKPMTREQFVEVLDRHEGII